MPKKTNFEANGQNYFRVTATIGISADGKRIRKQFYGKSFLIKALKGFNLLGKIVLR